MIELQKANYSQSSLERVTPIRLPLVNHFYKSCDYAVKCGSTDWVYTLVNDGKIIAAARLMPQASGDFLLRNLCVAIEYRRQGVASYLVEKMLPHLKPQNCYCYALPHLQDFYLSLNFIRLAVDEVPSSIGLIHERNDARKRGWILMGYKHPE
jgi:predicted GNAT family N-acyltransferase